jgi:hypothetical protein
MKSMKLRIAGALLILSFCATAQTPLAEGQLSLTTTQSEIVLGGTAKELPELLINAFKKGKLTAYSFGFRKQTVYGELKQWPNPKDWDESVSYDEKDSVLYKGKLYRYRFRRNEPGVIQLDGLTPDIAPDAYGRNDYWEEYKRVAPVVGYQYNLPSEKDILKVEQWEGVKAKGSIPIPYWDPHKVYFPGELVIYEGKKYEAIRDNVNSMPTGQTDWQLTNSGVSDDAFTEIQFVYDRETRLPIAFQLSLSYDSEPRIGFYFDAVQKFLLQTKQEVLAKKLEDLLRKKVH